MIRVSKPVVGPSRLSRGVGLTTRNCAAFDDAPAAFENGSKKFEYDNRIYGDASVKEELAVAQHKKCCYCEDEVGSSSPGDVEHFRPKGAVSQGRGHPISYPGYFWLAYDWSNLYYSCANCNRSGKKNYFPLADTTKRARSHSAVLADESPLLLDPGGADDPRDHIRFHLQVAVGITAKGRKSVEVFQLNRNALAEKRLAAANQIHILRKVVAIAEAKSSDTQLSGTAEARLYLSAAICPDGIFSAMIQDLLAGSGV